LILCFITLAALPLTEDHIAQALTNILMEIFAERLTTILRLFTYMKSIFSIA